MPELPEVEVVRRGIDPLIANRVVRGIGFSNKRLRLPVPRTAIRRWLIGGRCQDTGRRGKNLLLFFDNGAVLIIHLGMTGRLGVLPASAKRLAHEHCRIKLDNGMELRFSDPRRFGSLRLVPPGDDWQALFSDLGPEPLAADFTAAYLQARAAGRRQPVKSFLMDGRVVAGIGNIYACEILHAAGIAPTRPVSDIDDREWQRLVRHTRRVLQAAIDQGGTTIADFVDASGRPGYFQLTLAVYGRHDAPCPACGQPVARIRLAGRSTFFCPSCQR